MPKVLFYAGTAFCFFLAVLSGAEVPHELQAGSIAFGALHRLTLNVTPGAAWAVVIALLAATATAAIFIRMASLLAARHLFGAFLALFATGGAVTAVVWLMLLESRMLVLMRRGLSSSSLDEMHFGAVMMLGYFLSLALLALRPYFSIQASRALSALVFFPLPLFVLILLQELFAPGGLTAVPHASPASMVYFAVLAVLFFSIAVHCIRHRHLFIEMTNLRELLDPRVDPGPRSQRRPIGGVAFDS
jgi:hypothetical protein